MDLKEKNLPLLQYDTARHWAQRLIYFFPTEFTTLIFRKAS